MITEIKASDKDTRITAKITFKSTPENWEKEYSSKKRCTVRVIEKEDYRFTLISEYLKGHINRLDVTLFNTETTEIFSRQVTDVTYFMPCGVPLVILSW